MTRFPRLRKRLHQRCEITIATHQDIGVVLVAVYQCVHGINNNLHIGQVFTVIVDARGRSGRQNQLALILAKGIGFAGRHHKHCAGLSGRR